MVYEAILDVIGEEGTLVVPTFTYSFSGGKVFDPDNTPSDCGIFTEYIRKRAESFRSEDGNVSVAAIGRMAYELTAEVPENAYGEDSFFDRFYKAGGKVCNLNFDAGSTFIHYIERLNNVYYRFDKTFEGVLVKDGKESRRKSTIWVRKFEIEGSVAAFEKFDELATKTGYYKRKSVGRGFIGVMTASDVEKLIAETIEEYPNFLTKIDDV
jgi:aminoglycoside 3-N-acetyltransferase